MADTKLSALTAASALGGTELLAGVQSAASVKVTAAQIKTFTSASPSLVTPALGTPSSGTLTNATGLPAAGVVGTAAILGANTFTALQTFAAVGASFGSSVLLLDAANTLALRNGTTAQAFRVYKTYTDASNYERISLENWSVDASYFSLQVAAAGSGTARGFIIHGSGSAGIGFWQASTGRILFATNGVERWNIDSSGHLLANTDNTYDIGAFGATRPRTIYVGTTVLAGNNIIAEGQLKGAGGVLVAVSSSFSTGVLLTSPADTICWPTNLGQTAGIALQFMERTAPSAPATNNCYLYAQDNGSGKTQLMVMFPTGVAQEIKVEA